MKILSLDVARNDSVKCKYTFKKEYLNFCPAVPNSDEHVDPLRIRHVDHRIRERLQLVHLVARVHPLVPHDGLQVSPEQKVGQKSPF
jgi:hypothetical protein